MAHMIPAFPGWDVSREIASAILNAGIAYLEIQFPYSDPTADGPDIQVAAARSLANGFTAKRGFDFVRSVTAKAKAQHPEIPVFVMAYGGMVYALGVQEFLNRCSEAGASGVIVPDFMPWADEGLYAAAATTKPRPLHAIPVINVATPEHRLETIRMFGPAYLYISLRVGITGRKTEIGEENRSFVRRLTAEGYRVLAGFGITENSQVATIAEDVDATIVGSALVRVIAGADRGSEASAAAKFIENLTIR